MAKAKKNTPEDFDLDAIKREVKEKNRKMKISKSTLSQVVAWGIIAIAVLVGTGFYLGTQYADNQKTIVKQEATVLAKELVAKQTSKNQ